jgi:stringent starvation protein B
MEMTSSRPYLLRAIYQWIVDNDCTPYLLVDASYSAVVVPTQHIKDGQIVLNISPSAVVGLLMDDQAVSFNARFGGVPMDIYAPMGSLLGVYARENGQGMLFEAEEFPEPKPPAPDDDTGFKARVVENKDAKPEKSSSERPSLRVVK